MKPLSFEHTTELDAHMMHLQSSLARITNLFISALILTAPISTEDLIRISQWKHYKFRKNKNNRLVVVKESSEETLGEPSDYAHHGTLYLLMHSKFKVQVQFVSELKKNGTVHVREILLITGYLEYAGNNYEFSEQYASWEEGTAHAIVRVNEIVKNLEGFIQSYNSENKFDTEKIQTRA
jgi:hypothetical protein